LKKGEREKESINIYVSGETLAYQDSMLQEGKEKKKRKKSKLQNLSIWRREKKRETGNSPFSPPP